MTTRQTIFVPGKNPNPEEAPHSNLLWRILVEVMCRADSLVADTLQHGHAHFHLVNWHDLHDHSHQDVTTDIRRVDAIIGKHDSADGYMVSPAVGSIIADWCGSLVDAARIIRNELHQFYGRAPGVHIRLRHFAIRSNIHVAVADTGDMWLPAQRRTSMLR